MRILLLGEYSNVHHNLATGLRALGHDVIVASDGDGWKNYKRDIDLKRHSTACLDSLKFLARLKKHFHTFKDFDVVQIINPVFLSLKAERIWKYYNFLRKNNKKLFLGAFGMDYYYVKTCLDCKTFRYSDFNFGDYIRESDENSIWIKDWLKGEKGKLNQYIAKDCDGIIAGLYEYYMSYRNDYNDKLIHIPFPIHLSTNVTYKKRGTESKIRFFIGIQQKRSQYKGTDIMLNALLKLEQNYRSSCEVNKVESVPFYQYIQLMNNSDVILDQLYSYTPAMNALEAMAQGLVVVGGGEPEYYSLLGEEKLKPVINVLPDEEYVYKKLEDLLLNREYVETKSQESREFIEKYHDSIKVAKLYLDFWNSKPEPNPCNLFK